ncbi:hypothetical protein F3J45_16990 [Pantoea sp. Ap-967]|uniref:hypothetical protein n=1 Tax=Pantoea sp. Ap-967 TaxID=2608362 RepID=UPI0014226725|nr:hypothetical protein [Pantoea sp. Ap-967]NIE76136.1 hypothetical protein [Pantoea sp. Ap-967]
MSVTAPTHPEKKSGNRETNRQNFRPMGFVDFAQALDFKGFSKVGTAPAISLVQQQEKRDTQ